MKKRNIFFIAIIVIFIILAAISWWQFDNIKSVYYSYKYNNGQIDNIIQKHNGDVDKIIKDNDKLNVRPSTEVEQKLHQEELLTDKELENVLVGKNDVSGIFGTDVGLDEKKDFIDGNGDKITKDELLDAKKENLEDSGDKPDESDADAKASQSIARMYVLKSTFEAKLDALYNEAKAYYKSLSKEERKNAKPELFKKFYSRATQMEASCDAQVDAVLKDLESTLKQSGESLELVSKIRTAYNEEKSLKKAYYLNLHK